ncbi:hypothetical protein PPYR_02319 [Photinus pyralis]|uniref:Uncharacterized protein n=1 Tax=Photinus pyralis TaxID=7054 RepID=A0A5N4B6X3_PHOPY|nr:hypothetical protein PPYR_02319 [Photinus pyralis]
MADHNVTSEWWGGPYSYCVLIVHFITDNNQHLMTTAMDIDLDELNNTTYRKPLKNARFTCGSSILDKVWRSGNLQPPILHPGGLCPPPPPGGPSPTVTSSTFAYSSIDTFSRFTQISSLTKKKLNLELSCRPNTSTECGLMHANFYVYQHLHLDFNSIPYLYTGNYVLRFIKFRYVR